tara:strand:- start:598 stop:861 length:264 start_codon:yes stop_codon:yes gene_type:complete
MEALNLDVAIFNAVVQNSELSMSAGEISKTLPTIHSVPRNLISILPRNAQGGKGKPRPRPKREEEALRLAADWRVWPLVEAREKLSR